MKKLCLILFCLVALAYVAPVCLADEGVEQQKGVTEDASIATGLEQRPVDVGNKICPVSGEEINEEMKATYEYEGKIYNFCCAGCIDEFKEDPQTYIKKIEESQEEDIAQ